MRKKGFLKLEAASSELRIVMVVVCVIWRTEQSRGILSPVVDGSQLTLYHSSKLAEHGIQMVVSARAVRHKPTTWQETRRTR